MKSGALKRTKYQILMASDYSWLKSVTVTRSQENGDEFPSILGFDARFGVWVRARYDFKGAVTEEFELHSFPLYVRSPNVKRVRV